MRLTISHMFDIDVDRYWGKLFFDPEYNRRLYQDVLKFKGYEELELRDEGGGACVRTLRMEPTVDAPAPVRKVLGDRLMYTEKGRFDPVGKRWKYEVIPSTLADKVKIAGELRAEARGEKRLERIVDMEISIKVFGVGSMIESIIEKQSRADFDKAAQFTNAYLRERGL